MAPKRAAAAADPSSSTEEDGDSSSSDSATSHEQDVADDERGEKDSEEEEPESESEEEEWAAAAEVEEDEESTEEGGEEEEVDFQPIRRVDPPEEEEEDVDFQSIKRIDHRSPLLPAEADEPAAKDQPQSNKTPARDRKRASGEIGKLSEPKSKRIRRVWAPDDEVLILVSLAQHRRQHGELPAWGNFGFFESIRERLEDNSSHRTEIKDKVRSLHRRYISGAVSTTDHDRRLHKLSEDVWGDLRSIVTATGSINGKKQADGVFAISGAENAMPGAENGGRESDTKDFKEMCEMYPLLAQEVKLLADVQPGLESSFTRLDAKRALDIEKKLERVKYAELKIETQMVLEVHAPKAKIKKKLVSLLEKVSKNV